MILSAIKSTGERFGSGIVIDVLRGSRSKKITSKKFDKLEIYKQGKEYTQEILKEMIEMLVSEGYILEENKKNERNISITTFYLSQKSNLFLNSFVAPSLSIRVSPHFWKLWQAHLEKINKTNEKENKNKNKNNSKKNEKTSEESSQKNIAKKNEINKNKNNIKNDEIEGKKNDEKEEKLTNELMQILFEERRKISEEQNIAPFLVCSEQSLWEMSKKKPFNFTDFSEIEGINESKAKNYHSRFCNLISQFCKKNFSEKNFSKKKIENLDEISSKSKRGLVFSLFQDGLSVSQISSSEKLTRSKVINYLIDVFEKDRHSIDEDSLVDELSLTKKDIKKIENILGDEKYKTLSNQCKIFFIYLFIFLFINFFFFF